MTIINGKVKYPSGKILNTTNGPRINVVVLMPDGEEKKIWGNPKDEISKLKKGDEIELVKTVNGGLKLLSKAQEMEPEPQSTESPTISKLADKLSECFDAMQARQPDLCEESIRTMAISLFIQSAR